MDNEQTNNQEQTQVTSIYRNEEGRLIYMSPQMRKAKEILREHMEKERQKASEEQSVE